MELIFGMPSEEKTSGKKDFDVIIVGAGPAGLSAAIYASRAGLEVLVLDKGVAGGLVGEDPLVENYLGFKSIKGEDLANKFKEHALEYAEIHEGEGVDQVKKDNGKFIVQTYKGEYTADALIIATGTTHRHLNIPGEKEYEGKGVSFCVTCDGFLFKDKPVAVIGGGNSGAIAAITLKDITDSVTVIEFMPRWMCESAYRKKIEELGIEYRTNSEVVEIFGDGKKVQGIKVKNRETGEIQEIRVDGVFIYVGLIPQNEVAKQLGVELTEKGYIKVDGTQRTNVERVYAAGDITGSQAQIIVAAGQGAVAALSAYEDLRLK